MRLLTTFAILSMLPWTVAAAPTWQTISSEPGKRIELDRTSIKRDGNTVQAQGRVVLEKEIIDTKSGAGYRVIEAITRYDCVSRNANTIKRIYKKNENEVIRDETLKSPELPVRSGTLDDKVLREVCRPPKESVTEVAQRANEATEQLKQANEKLVKKDAAPTEKPPVIKASDAAPNLIPSIRPNLKAAVEANKEAAPATATQAPPPQAPPPAPVKPAATPYKSSTVVVRSSSPTQKPRKPAAAEGYMLELAQPVASLQSGHIVWDYEGMGGPENWSRLDPRNTACNTGQRQSPIDIRDGIKVDLEPIKFNYRPSQFRVVDNGRTIQVKLGDNSISLTGKTYELVHIEFHRPSEEKINGQRFDMSAHLVHKADDGQLAVLAVLLERGQENPFIQTIWNNLPLEKQLPVQPPGSTIDVSALLPASRNYYTYMGSMTTPPCTEGVLWLVMKQPVAVSPEQVSIFSRFYQNNARPIQPAAGRTIKEGR